MPHPVPVCLFLGGWGVASQPGPPTHVSAYACVVSSHITSILPRNAIYSYPKNEKKKRTRTTASPESSIDAWRRQSKVSLSHPPATHEVVSQPLGRPTRGRSRAVAVCREQRPWNCKEKKGSPLAAFSTPERLITEVT